MPPHDDMERRMEAYRAAYELNDRDAWLSRQLPDGRWLDVQPLTLGRARIVVSRGAGLFYDMLDGW